MGTIDWGSVLTGVITAAVTGAGALLWVRFSALGRDIWQALGQSKVGVTCLKVEASQ
jgi:hypothetical protein